MPWRRTSLKPVRPAAPVRARRAEFIGEIDRYVLSAVQLSDTEDKKAKTYTVTVRAEINTTLLQTKLDAGSAVAGATAAQRC